MTQEQDQYAHLTRSRKTTYIDPESGLETIRQDLECCGTTFRSAYDCNQHYKTRHHDIPLSDPITWPLVYIKNPVKHAELNLLLPYTPFPAAQPQTSTWTVRFGARALTGDREERERKRSRAKNQSLIIHSLKDEVSDLKTTVARIRLSRNEERTRHKNIENDENKKQKELQADKNLLQLQLEALRSASHAEPTVISQDSHAPTGGQVKQLRKDVQSAHDMLANANKQIHKLSAENESLQLQVESLRSDNEKGLIRLLEGEVDRLGLENDELRAQVKAMPTVTTPVI